MKKKVLLCLLLAVGLILTSCTTVPSANRENGMENTNANGENGNSVLKGTTYLVADNIDLVKTVGRVSTGEQGVTLYWSNSAIAFQGTMEGTVALETNGHFSNYTYQNIAVVIDGNYATANRYRVYNGKNTVVIAENLAAGEHTVEVFKLNEAAWGYFDISGITVNGTLGEKPADKKLQIEFIGDSITCGLGIYPAGGRNIYPSVPGQDLEEENSYYAYASIASRRLNADASFVSASGWGLTIGNKDETMVIPDIYEQTCAFADTGKVTWDFGDKQMDVVVVSLGTNDWYRLDCGEADVIKEGVHSFLTTIRQKYPNAQIVWCYGFMLTDMEATLMDAIDTFGDPDVHYLSMYQNTSGGAGHPEYYAHLENGNRLVALLQTLGVI